MANFYINQSKSPLRENPIIHSNIIKTNITETLDEISRAYGEIIKATNRSKLLSKEMLKNFDNLAECDLQLSRYESLKEKYNADIKRLAFIIEGELNSMENMENLCCPFCMGTPKSLPTSSYIDAVKMELKNIIYKLEGLKEATNDVILEKKNLEILSESLKKERIDIEKLLNSILKPHIASLKGELFYGRDLSQRKRKF